MKDALVRRPLSDLAITLVSVAIGEPYETSLKKMGATARDAGFNRTLLWTRQEFLADPNAIKHRASLEKMQQGHRQRKKRHPYDRPYCGSFKPFVILRALLESRDGDYVMWSDASKYHDARYIGVSVRDAVAVLTGRVSAARPPAATSVQPTRSRTGSSAGLPSRAEPAAALGESCTATASTAIANSSWRTTIAGASTRGRCARMPTRFRTPLGTDART